MADQSPSYAVPSLVGEGAIYFTGEDSLRISTQNPQSNTLVTVSGRFLPFDRARIEPFSHLVRVNIDGTPAVVDRPLGEGWLLNVTVTVASGGGASPTTFVRVDVIRGRGGAVTVLATLLQGMMQETQRAAWPGSIVQFADEMPGRTRSVTGTDPAAGVEISETVPSFQKWKVRAITFTLVASGVAGNRDIVLTFDDGTNTYATIPIGLSQTAGQTITHTFALGLFRISVAGFNRNSPLPDLIMLAGHRLRTVTTGLDAGDNFSAPQYLVEEWFDAS